MDKEKYCFPEYGVVFEAESLEEANKMLKNYLLPNKKEVGVKK